MSCVPIKNFITLWFETPAQFQTPSPFFKSSDPLQLMLSTGTHGVFLIVISVITETASSVGGSKNSENKRKYFVICSLDLEGNTN